MGGGEPVGHLDVAHGNGLRDEAVDVHPPRIAAGLQDALEALLDDAKPPAGQLVHVAGSERDRLGQRAEPEASVGKSRPALHLNAQHEVGARAHDTGRSPEFDAREHRLDVRAKRLQTPGQSSNANHALASADHARARRAAYSPSRRHRRRRLPVSCHGPGVRSSRTLTSHTISVASTSVEKP
jgi:hypothetical protein